MVLKKQTVWLLSMLTIMVVLSAYYLIQGPIEQVPVASDAKQASPLNDIQVDSKQVTDSKQVMEDKNVEKQALSNSESSDYFLQVKMDRDNWNSARMEEILSVMSNSEASSEAIAKAKQSYDELLTKQETEMTVENLIKALGYNEAVIITKEDRVNVIVQADKLERKNAVEIVSLVTQHMDVPGKNVVVSYKP